MHFLSPIPLVHSVVFTPQPIRSLLLKEWGDKGGGRGGERRLEIVIGELLQEEGEHLGGGGGCGGIVLLNSVFLLPLLPFLQLFPMQHLGFAETLFFPSLAMTATKKNKVRRKRRPHWYTRWTVFTIFPQQIRWSFFSLFPQALLRVLKREEEKEGEEKRKPHPLPPLDSNEQQTSEWSQLERKRRGGRM